MSLHCLLLNGNDGHYAISAILRTAHFHQAFAICWGPKDQPFAARAVTAAADGPSCHSSRAGWCLERLSDSLGEVDVGNACCCSIGVLLTLEYGLWHWPWYCPSLLTPSIPQFS